ncbi:MAG: phosphoglycolate phosphatase [Candidatus Methanomethylicota archaeon]|uniref:Phosphoglycolate phosphatase n=1 Tax=Thermoproteota archaeon TaxID=2056631 RepID=A0A497EZN0_9CREN|nr:MAG: phosphoglycolate phosphatase [Candidatus Verstraetearchaeota archaeon]
MIEVLKKVKAIAIDVDGTITDETGALHLESIRVLRKVKEKLKIKVVLASGNAYPVLMGLARYIGKIDLVIAENGGVVGFQNKFKINGNPEIGLKARKLISEKLGDIVYESWQNKFRFVDFAFKLREGHTWSEAVKKVKHLIEGEVPEAVVAFSGVAIHVKDRVVNKGVGLRIAAEMLNLNPKDFMAIGDSDVDVEMMIEAGISIAVSNASKKAIKVANIVTSKPRGWGFIEALEMLLKTKS